MSSPYNSTYMAFVYPLSHLTSLSSQFGHYLEVMWQPFLLSSDPFLFISPTPHTHAPRASCSHSLPACSLLPLTVMQPIFLLCIISSCVLVAAGYRFRQAPRCMVSLKARNVVQQRGQLTALFAMDDDDAAESTGSTAPVKSDPGISSEMRKRLLRENASLGGDANSKSGNPILIVAAVVGVLAIASSLIGAL